MQLLSNEVDSLYRISVLVLWSLEQTVRNLTSKTNKESRQDQLKQAACELIESRISFSPIRKTHYTSNNLRKVELWDNWCRTSECTCFMCWVHYPSMWKCKLLYRNRFIDILIFNISCFIFNLPLQLHILFSGHKVT